MRRLTISPRTDWQTRVEKIGLTYHTLADGKPYWDESAYWEFKSAEIDRLEAATAEIQRLALAAGDVILNQDRLAQMGIPAAAVPAIRAAWNSEPPALYGGLTWLTTAPPSSCWNTTLIPQQAWLRPRWRNGTGCRTAFQMRISSTHCMKN